MSDGGAQPEERRLACATSAFHMFLTANSCFLVCYLLKKENDQNHCDNKSDWKLVIRRL